MQTYKNTTRGYTLVELMAVLVILSIMAAILVPPLTGFIDKVKKQQHVIEAREVSRSINLYLIDHYAEEIDSVLLMSKLTSYPLNSSEHPLADYLTVTCSKDAAIENLTLDTSSRRVIEFVYLVGGYRVKIDGAEVAVTRVAEQLLDGDGG